MNTKNSVKKGKQACRFVEVKKAVYTHKTTAIWLLQERKRVSSDWLFRVRVKQTLPTNKSALQNAAVVSTMPTVCNTVEVDAFCVFTFRTDHDHNMDWRIGKQLPGFCVAKLARWS